MSEASPRRTSVLKSPAFWSVLIGLGVLAGPVWQLARRPPPPLPELGALPPMELQDQEGRAFTLARLRGRTSIVNFIFTSCPSVCPILTRKMASLQDTIARQGLDVQLVSFSVDPETDTTAVLREYAARYHADAARWSFVTGQPDEVVAAVAQGFKIAVERERPDASTEIASGFALVHGENFVLVDREARIRGYYQKDDADLSRLLQDAGRLAQEGTR